MEFDEIFGAMQELRYYARQNFIPIIRDKSAKLLYDFVKDREIKTILEIGTAIGYSGCIMLSAGAKKLITIDINEEYLMMAKNTFDKFNYVQSVKIIKEDALLAIQTLAKQRLKFDMIFLDGAKGQYVKYLPILKNLLTNNGYIFADNVLLGGLVESQDDVPHKKRSMVRHLREYMSRINAEPYETKILRVEDGIAITKIRGGKI